MSEAHYFCPLCHSPNLFQNYSTLFTHIRNQHREESPFSIRCELTALCGCVYSSFNSYRRHIYRCHRTLIDSFENSNAVSSNIDMLDNLEDSFFRDNQPDTVTDSESLIYPDEELDETDRIFLNFDPISFSFTDQQRHFERLAQLYTRFLLELREYHLLPQKIVQSISSNFCKLFDIVLELIKTKILSSVVSVVDLETTFTAVNRIINSVSKNEYTFLKQCEKYFKYQPPSEIILNTNTKRAYYIPLKQSLSPLLHSGELLEAMLNNINSLATRSAGDNDIILSNRQSQSVIYNIVRQTNPNSLLLKLYTDGIAITNPIGPKKDSHKLTCFYYLLDDLPDIVRSQVDSVGLHCICYTKHLNDENSRKTLMNVLVEDLNLLQTEGISVPCLSSRVYFVFSSICADNLAANEVGGFQRNFSTGNFCRHCLITYEQRHISLSDISFVPRTRWQHDMIIDRITTNNIRATIQGVNNYSWFKDLIGFHPTESLPPDIMHDTAEGVCPLIISALLKECIQKRILTYAEIERRTSSFVYGYYDSSNKPPPIKKQQLTYSNVAGSASQKLCFFRLFPIVFHDVIDQLTLLPLYTIFREIISYIYANPIRKSWLAYLDELCKQFHFMMIEFLPDNVTPKVHFITEYPRSIEKYGLPILNSCIRFEAKHLYFKQIANCTFNFKNPLLTLLKRHQLRRCLLSDSNPSSYSPSMIIRSSKSVDLFELAIPVQRLLNQYINQADSVFECNSIVYHHKNIRAKSVIVHDLAHTEEIPIFCQVHHLLNAKDKWFIIAEELNTISFNDKLWSYEVEFSGKLIKIDIEKCFDILPHCLDTYLVEQTRYNLYFCVLDEDIDGETLVLLQNNDIMNIFPRIKDRVKFIDLRSKMISNLNEQDENNDESTGVLNENTIRGSSVSNEAQQSNNDIDPMTDPDPSSNIVCSDDDNDDALTKATLPIDYEVPQLTVRMQHYIDDNNISKFNPHTTLRGELLSILFDDVTTSHQLFYPTNNEYMTMAKCIVKKLCIASSLVHQSIRDWHESIKQKFKRERKPLQMVNNFVQAKQNKYGKTKGRPKQKSAILQAERKIKDTPMINLTDKQNENLLSIVNNMNMELLKDKPDNDTLNDLWTQSFNIRRLCIRELSIDEILERFPAYRRPELILAEVKDTVGVDINKNTNDLLPHFFDCIPDNSCFLSDVLPFRVIRVLCKIFGDPVGNIFTHEDILVPYPCIKISDDKFELYVDFHL
ncbi:unnamed protein product, partial [Rotaria magnacalcarata]